MKKLITLIMVLCALGAKQAIAQDVAVKTNTLYWATTTLNAAAEFATSDKVTVELMGAYNPWNFKDGKKMHMWAAQPEVKYWFCEKFEGHFVGVHAHGGQFFGGFHSKRYDGYFAGAGLSYGYDWILSPHWNLEAEIGLGYAYLWYKESPRIDCRKCEVDKHKHYIGPTRVAITFSYIF